MGEWRDISTAPRDGSRIMLGNAADDEADICAHATMGHWQEAENDGIDYMGADAGFVDIDYDVYRPSRSFGSPSHMYEARQPTHWQPLPEPPKATES